MGAVYISRNLLKTAMQTTKHKQKGQTDKRQDKM